MQCQLLVSALRRRPEFQVSSCLLDPDVILHAIGSLPVQVTVLLNAKGWVFDEAEHRYFESAGLEVLGGACLGIADGFRLAEPEPETLFELGHKGFDARSDALIMTCLNTRSHTVIDRLEKTLGKPVITSTQATLWHALRLAGIADRIMGFGKLLEAH